MGMSLLVILTHVVWRNPLFLDKISLPPQNGGIEMTKRENRDRNDRVPCVCHFEE